MVYRIFDGGAEINRIVANESFVKTYCEENGYTYEAETQPEPEPEVSQLDRVEAQALYTALVTDTLLEEG